MSTLTNTDKTAIAISGTTSINQSPMNRKKVKDLNDVITCFLCSGYLIEPTTITECMHTFCRSCVVNHLEKHKHCPACRSNKQILVTNLRIDKTIRSLVFKLVPDLYKSEVDRRKLFNHENKIVSRPKRLGLDDLVLTGNEIVDCDFDDDEFFSLTELISLSLTYDPDSLATFEGAAAPAVKYLNCPAALTVRQMQKFLSMKFDLNMNNGMIEIEVIYEDVVLVPSDSLMDVAYKFHWNRAAPMAFFYRIFMYSPTPVPMIDNNQVKIENDLSSSEVKIENCTDIQKMCNNNKNIKTVLHNNSNSGAGKRELKSVRFEDTIDIDISANQVSEIKSEDSDIDLNEDCIKPVKLSQNSRRLNFTEDVVEEKKTATRPGKLSTRRLTCTEEPAVEPKTSHKAAKLASRRATCVEDSLVEPKTFSSKIKALEASEGKALKQPKIQTSPNNDFKSLRSNDIKTNDYVVQTKADSTASKPSSRSGTVTANDSKYSSNAVANNNNNNNNNTKPNSTKVNKSEAPVVSSNVDSNKSLVSQQHEQNRDTETHRSEAKYKRVEPNVRTSAPIAATTPTAVVNSSTPDRRFSFCEDDNMDNLSLTAMKSASRKCTVKLNHSPSVEEKCLQQLELAKEKKHYSDTKDSKKSSSLSLFFGKKRSGSSIESSTESSSASTTPTTSSSSSPIQQQVDLTEYAKNIGLKPICPVTETRNETTTSKSHKYEDAMKSSKKLEAEAGTSSHKKRKKSGKHSKEPGSKRPKIHAQIKSHPNDLVMKLKILKEDRKSSSVEESGSEKKDSVKFRVESGLRKESVNASGSNGEKQNAPVTAVSKPNESSSKITSTVPKSVAKLPERANTETSRKSCTLTTSAGTTQVSMIPSTESSMTAKLPKTDSSKPTASKSKLPDIRPISVPSNSRYSSSPRHSTNFLVPDAVVPRTSYTPPILPSNKSMHVALKRSASIDNPSSLSKYARTDSISSSPSNSRTSVMMSPRPIPCGNSYSVNKFGYRNDQQWGVELEETMARLNAGRKPHKYYNSAMSTAYTYENVNRKPLPMLLPPSSISVTKMNDTKQNTPKIDDRPALEIVCIPQNSPTPDSLNSGILHPKLPVQTFTNHKSLPIYGPVNQAKNSSSSTSTSSPKVVSKTTRPPPPTIPLVKIKKANAAINSPKSMTKTTSTIATVASVSQASADVFGMPPKKTASDAVSINKSNNLNENDRQTKTNDVAMKLDITSANTRTTQSQSSTTSASGIQDAVVALDLSGKSSRSPSIEKSPTNTFSPKQKSLSPPQFLMNSATKSTASRSISNEANSNTNSGKKPISMTTHSSGSKSLTPTNDRKHADAKLNRTGNESSPVQHLASATSNVSDKKHVSTNGHNKQREGGDKLLPTSITKQSTNNGRSTPPAPRVSSTNTPTTSKNTSTTTTTTTNSSKLSMQPKSSSAPSADVKSGLSPMQNLKLLSESATNREKIKAATSSAYAALSSPSVVTSSVPATATVALTSSTITSPRPLPLPKLNEINKIRSSANVRPHQSASVRNVPNPSALAHRQQAAQALHQLETLLTEAPPRKSTSPVDVGSSSRDTSSPRSNDSGKKREKNIEVLALKLGAAAVSGSATANGKSGVDKEPVKSTK